MGAHYGNKLSGYGGYKLTAAEVSEVKEAVLKECRDTKRAKAERKAQEKLLAKKSWDKDRLELARLHAGHQIIILGDLEVLTVSELVDLIRLLGKDPQQELQAVFKLVYERSVNYNWTDCEDCPIECAKDTVKVILEKVRVSDRLGNRCVTCLIREQIDSSLNTHRFRELVCDQLKLPYKPASYCQFTATPKGILDAMRAVGNSRAIELELDILAQQSELLAGIAEENKELAKKVKELEKRLLLSV